MDKFSIDDVRDSFAADISGQISKLATAGRQLAESAELSWKPADIGQPQFEAMLSSWNFTPDVPDSAFTFTPAAGAREIPFLVPRPATQP